jgi:putative FmdB family regulatory protein
MPLYPFACPDCETEFETLVARPSAAAAVECPNCSGKNVTRLLSLPAKVTTPSDRPATNCRGDGPPCGASWCGRGRG